MLNRFAHPAVFFTAMLATAALAAPVRFPLTLANVAAALAVQQPQLAASALQMPTMTSSTPDPELVVEAIASAGKGEAKVRMACRSAADCLPFYVTVRGADTASFTQPAALPRPQTRAALPQPPTLRSGARATLRIDSGVLHITLPVIALGSGTIGGEVRVTSLDHHMTYMARVVSPNQVQGSL